VAAKPLRFARIETSYARDTVERGAAAAPGAMSSLDDLARLKPDTVFRELHRSRFGCDPAPDLLLAFGELLRASPEEATR